VNTEGTLPLEHFIQAVQRQLDNAQTAMAVKAKNFNLPLTFAIKDITLDLRAHVEFARSEIRIRPAGPSDADASVFHLVFTAITRPMIEENAIAFQEDPDDTFADEMTEEEKKKLEWSGVRTRTQLRELTSRGGERAVERITGLPADRLRRALSRSAEPVIADIVPAEAPSSESTFGRLRLRGRNLMSGGPPSVTIGGSPVSVLSATADEVVIAPGAHQLAGELRLSTRPDSSVATALDLRPLWARPDAARADVPPAGGGLP
jgi:hypothetical protein